MTAKKVVLARLHEVVSADVERELLDAEGALKTEPS